MTAAAAFLVGRAAAGDRSAFGVLVAESLPDLNRLCRRLVGPALADDCVQDALMLALVRLATLREPETFGWWLRGIAIRVCRRARARVAPHVPLPPHEEPDARPLGSAAELALDERLVTGELVRGVRAAVAGLPAGQRGAVELFYLRGLSYEAAANSLGVSVGALKTRLHKARAALAHHYRLTDRRPWRPDDRTLAVHEAAHAVLGWQDGHNVLRIAITPRAAAHFGFVSAKPPRGGIPAAARLAMIMAGEAAVARALPHRARTDSGDRADAAHVARAVSGGDDQAAALIVSGALAAARVRLNDRRTWSLVERVAGALTERRELDGDDFRTLVTA